MTSSDNFVSVDIDAKAGDENEGLIHGPKTLLKADLLANIENLRVNEPSKFKKVVAEFYEAQNLVLDGLRDAVQLNSAELSADDLNSRVCLG
jgi:hypothetical protein